MERKGVIEKVNEPTEWVNPLVITKKKNEQIRICLDPTNLNKCIKRQHYVIPSFEEISAQMPNAKVFSTLDADSGFWQIKLSKKSSKYVTFITPYGRFKFNVMPFGISPATEVFQACFDEPVTLSVDASQNGLGAVLLQENLPIAYASKALTEIECRYAQIEKEALAIAFACSKFHQYIVGKNVIIESDHKPLESIFTKPINQTPPRIQRIILGMQKYNIKVKYKPGKDLLLADALSRAYIVDEKHDYQTVIENEVCMLMPDFPISIEKKEDFKIETNKDETLKIVKKFIINGWPKHKNLVPLANGICNSGQKYTFQ